jgi:hypothetical protein
MPGSSPGMTKSGKPRFFVLSTKAPFLIIEIAPRAISPLKTWIKP